MNCLHFPWVEAAVAVLLGAAGVIGQVQDTERGRRGCMLACTVVLLLMVGGWADFHWLGPIAADEGWNVRAFAPAMNLLVIDELNVPLLPLTALVYLLTAIVTTRAKIRQLSFVGTLASEAIVLATLSCRLPWGIILLLAMGTIPPYLELRKRGNSARVFAMHMLLAIIALAVGWARVGSAPEHAPAWAYALLAVGVMVRSGIVPLHCWATDLFENASFGTSLLYTVPMLGAYAAVRLILPGAPTEILQAIAILCLLTAVYAAAMALIQRSARRFFCCVFLSNSALVLAGLCSQTVIGLTGALGVWLAAEISLAGFGLVLRALESRHGRLSMQQFHGLYEHTPQLAMCFLLTGLASVGFPGTLGFLSSELLIDGAVQAFPIAGIAVVIAAALNGIAVMQAYFRLFTGTRHATTVSLKIGSRERITVLALVALALGGGVYPQPGITSRHRAAKAILQERTSTGYQRTPLRSPVTLLHEIGAGAGGGRGRNGR